MTDGNLYQAFAAHFPAPDTEFLRATAGERYTYGDLDTLSARLARHLTRLGLAPGDRLTVQADKSPAALWLYLACLRAGIVFHPLNPAYTPAEVDYFVGDAAPAMLAGDDATIAGLRALATRHGVPRTATVDGLLADAADAPPGGADARTMPDSLAALLYSSGTTGKPKGIMLSHRNLAANARALTAAWGFTAADVLLHMLPTFHVHGLFVALGCTLMSGSRLIFCPKFDAARALDLLPSATVMMGVPTYYTRLLAEPALTAERCRGIRLFTSGSAPLLAETWHAFRARTGHAVLERYGMTETSIITTNPLVGERRPGAVGFPLPGMEVRIADEADRVVTPGSTGHVQVRGASVFQGYWRQPDKTREDFTGDGWFRTGDDGRFDADGYLSLVGRAKDLVITGGLNVYPSEVETVLDELPEIAESAVIGLPHADFGEQVIAAIVLAPGATWDDTRAAAIVRTRLAAYKCPKRYHVLAELPRNAMGKVQKNVLRERLAAV